MGLKGSGPFFQRSMSNKVLAGYVTRISEIYIDDVLIHGSTDMEYLGNTRKVLGRLREKKVTAIPAKTRLGLKEVEYVGHLISSTGTSYQVLVDELHEYYKKENQKKDEADRIEVRNSQIRDAQKETEHFKKQFENAMSLVETQKLSIKLLQDELDEEAEFDAEETAQMRSVRRECETRVNNYEDRIAELQSDMQKEIDKQAYLLKKVTKERDGARSELNESQQSARNLFNEQKRLEKSEDRLKMRSVVLIRRWTRCERKQSVFVARSMSYSMRSPI
jgi:chromosome segregation ATPase